MTTLKTLKDGRVALIFETEQVAVAAQLFSAIVGNAIPQIGQMQPIKKQSKSLEDIKMTLNTTKLVPALSNLNGFGAEKAASEILTIISDKQREVFGNVMPQRFRTFYSELEQQTGATLNAGYKAYVGCNNKKDYPYRKIDYVLTVLPREVVYDYAKKFQFKTVGASA